MVPVPETSLLDHVDLPRHTTWQEAIRNAIRDPRVLFDWLDLQPDQMATVTEKNPEFPFFVTWEYATRILPQDRYDPLLLQILPSASESQIVPGFVNDPVGDLAVQSVPGLLHKYRGRVLLIASGTCAIHCRYCFRQHFPYSETPKSNWDWGPALEYIAGDDTVEEVILSGGDPLTLVDAKLAWLVQQLDAIPHLKRLRIHTRLPIVVPQRVCDSMLNWLSRCRLSKWIVLHVNHAREIDLHVAESVQKLRHAGAVLLNQAVLLRSVNDDTQTMVQLSQRLMECSIMPYYLHQLDPVQGAAHFHVPIERGQTILREMAQQLPGYGVPKYVSEIAGEPHKTILT